MKFRNDECLSPELAQLVHAKGHGASSHVVWLGRVGLKDWELKPVILNGDWTFVTKNSVEFRDPATGKPDTFDYECRENVSAQRGDKVRAAAARLRFSEVPVNGWRRLSTRAIASTSLTIMPGLMTGSIPCRNRGPRNETEV